MPSIHAGFYKFNGFIRILYGFYMGFIGFHCENSMNWSASEGSTMHCE